MVNGVLVSYKYICSEYPCSFIWIILIIFNKKNLIAWIKTHISYLFQHLQTVDGRTFWSRHQRSTKYREPTGDESAWYPKEEGISYISPKTAHMVYLCILIALSFSLYRNNFYSRKFKNYIGRLDKLLSLLCSFWVSNVGLCTNAIAGEPCSPRKHGTPQEYKHHVSRKHGITQEGTEFSKENWQANYSNWW